MVSVMALPYQIWYRMAILQRCIRFANMMPPCYNKRVYIPAEVSHI